MENKLGWSDTQAHTRNHNASLPRGGQLRKPELLGCRPGHGEETELAQVCLVLCLQCRNPPSLEPRLMRRFHIEILVPLILTHTEA